MIIRLDKVTYVNLARVAEIRCDVTGKAVFRFDPEHVLNSNLPWEEARTILDALVQEQRSTDALDRIARILSISVENQLTNTGGASLEVLTELHWLGRQQGPPHEADR